MSDSPSRSTDTPPSHDPPPSSSATSPPPTSEQATSDSHPAVGPASSSIPNPSTSDPTGAGGPAPAGEGNGRPAGEPPAGPRQQFYFQFVFPPTLAAGPGTPPAAAGPGSGPPNAEARARFFERLQRMGFPGGQPPGGPRSASPQPTSNADLSSSEPPQAAGSGPAEGGSAPGDVQAFEDLLDREMAATFAGEPSAQAQHAPPPPSADSVPPPAQPPSDAPRPNVRPSNFPFAGLMPMGFPFARPSAAMLAQLGLGQGAASPAGPPPSGSPPLATQDAPAGLAGSPPPAAPQPSPGFGDMPPEMVTQMASFFPGFSIFPNSPPAGVPANLPTDGSPAPAAPSATDGAAPAGPAPPTGQAGPSPTGPASGLPSFLNLLASQIMSQMVPPPVDPNAPPADPNAPPPLPNGGAPIVITLHFGGPPPQEEKEPDPERAKELLSALDKPERSLVERLDRGLRLEEEEAGVEVAERTGARCSVCLDSLLEPDEVEGGSAKAEVEGKDEDTSDVAMADDKEDDVVVSLPCSHAFHKSCLGPWLEMHTNCPTCRFDLDPLSTTLRPNRHATTLPSRTSTPTPSGLAVPSSSNQSSANASTSTSNRAHPYSRPPTRPSTPQPSRPSSAAATAPPTPRSGSQPPSNDRPYTPPPARLTLLSRVLSLESSHHLRCSLPLCTHAPSSSNPSGFPTKAKMFPLVRAEGDLAPETFGGERKRWVLNACEHVFHGDCLRIAEGVEFEGGVERDAMGRRKVYCPVRGCKGEGWVRNEDWEMEDEDEEDERRVEREMAAEEVKMDHTVAPMDIEDSSASTTAPATTAVRLAQAEDADLS